MTNRYVERTLLRKSTRVAHYAEGIHLQAIIVVEAKWLMSNHSFVWLEATALQPFS